MKRILISIILLSSITFSQETDTASINLFSPSNTKKFVDYLFCKHDYLRAINEYHRYLEEIQNDSIEFKIALAYSAMGDYSKASEEFNSIKKNSIFYSEAELEFLKSVFQMSLSEQQSGDFLEYRNFYHQKVFKENDDQFSRAKSLYYFSFLLTDNSLPDQNIFLNSFPLENQKLIKQFYEWKNDPATKSPLAAALMSVIIPGAGKFYVHEYSDGIWAFIATVGLGFLAYDNFNAGHNFRGWIFTGLSAGFYAGNIYGSAAAAQIYNARIQFDFVNDLKSFLEKQNYFLPIFNFCK